MDSPAAALEAEPASEAALEAAPEAARKALAPAPIIIVETGKMFQTSATVREKPTTAAPKRDPSSNADQPIASSRVDDAVASSTATSELSLPDTPAPWLANFHGGDFQRKSVRLSLYSVYSEEYEADGMLDFNERGRSSANKSLRAPEGMLKYETETGAPTNKRFSVATNI